MTDTSLSGDLVERLRYQGYLNSDNGDWGLRNPDGPEAADRIEALEAEVERLRDDSWFDQFEEQEQLRDNAEQRLSVVEAENERLRGVLIEIRDCTGEHGGAAKALKLISAALGEK